MQTCSIYSSRIEQITRLQQNSSVLFLFLLNIWQDSCGSNLCYWGNVTVMNSALTCASKSIACIPSVARAGVTPFNVVARCMGVTPVSASSALIHICRSQAIAVRRKLAKTCLTDVIYKRSQGMVHTEWLLGDWLWDLCSTTRAEDSGGWWFFVIYQWQNTGGSSQKP